MKHWLLFILFVLLSALASKSMAQGKSDNVCYISNNRIYFQLDKRWTDTKKREISTLFNLDSALIAQAIEGKPIKTTDSIDWLVNRIDDNLVELSKSVEKNKTAYNPNDVFLIDENLLVNPFVGIPAAFFKEKKYGINKFTVKPAFTYEKGVAHFYLPGFQKTGQVYLSGTFNNWSTMQLPMIKTGSGWEVSLELAPGRYLYKYITDGRWIHDPNNQLKEKDGRAGYNSVLFCYNHLFKLKGYSGAKKVYVSGSFNNWKTRDLKMNSVPGGWSLPVYLMGGTHAYKFIIDGKWINDPDNKIVRADASGNMNSFMGIGDTIIFRLKGYNSAENVILTGGFNGWSTNELVMNKTPDGWELPYVIGAGNYEYKFIVDGKWIPDPANPLTSGTGDYMNSVLTFKPNYTFILKQFTEAQNVFVTGSFNSWQEDSYRMVKKDNIWTCPVYLKPGKYTYKFIVDGHWLLDPANDVWEENREGTGNSVLWIEH